jgi:hypothetical protein
MYLRSSLLQDGLCIKINIHKEFCHLGYSTMGHAGSILGLFFNIEDGGNMFPRNIG